MSTRRSKSGSDSGNLTSHPSLHPKQAMTREVLVLINEFISLARRQEQVWPLYSELLEELASQLSCIASVARQTMRPHRRQDAFYGLILQQFGPHVTLRQLTAIAATVAEIAHVDSPSRNDRREKDRMVAWFENHWLEIQAFLPDVRVQEFALLPSTALDFIEVN
jgi:hypothetical protein